MSFPGVVGFALVIGVALGTALYMILNMNDPRQQYRENPPSPSISPDYGPSYDTPPKRRRNSNRKQCSICLDHINGTGNVVTLTCTHVFHNHCIEMWLRTKGTCPLCRKDSTIMAI